MKHYFGIALISLLSLSAMGCQKPTTSVTTSAEASEERPSSTGTSEAFSSSTFITSSEEENDPCEHVYSEEVMIKKATIIEPGINQKFCTKCHKVKEEPFYDLDEFVFEDGYFMYDGKAHDLTIKGMIPYGTTVEYVNNSLKDIGQKEVIANIYDSNHKLLTSKKANIHIINNTGLANIYIDTNNVAIADKENYVPMTLKTDNCDSKYVLNDVVGNIKLRGNGTLTYDKKAYRLKFDNKVNLLGVNQDLKAKSWVLIADYADQSMMRNATAYYIGNSLFNYSNNYCSDYKHVNVYLNNKYNGVYLLAEQQQTNSGRVNINEPENGYTGTDIGYLLELDYYATEEDYYFTIGNSSGSSWGGYPGWGGGGENINGVNIPNKDYTIKSDVFDQKQVSYIKKYLTNVFTALKNIFKDGKLQVLDDEHNLIDSPYTSEYETLNSMIDLDSLFKTYVLQEYMKNIDVGYSSFYMFVDFSKKSLYPRLTFGAPWDFDWSSGNVNTSVKSATGEYNSTDFQNKNVWLYLLSKTDFFKAMFKKYYSVFANSQILEGAIAQANYEASAFKSDFAHNYEKWPTLGTIVPKYTPDDVKSFKTHQDAVDYLTNWLNKRKSSLNGIFLK